MLLEAFLKNSCSFGFAPIILRQVLFVSTLTFAPPLTTNLVTSRSLPHLLQLRVV